MRINQKNSGFTLVELLTILGILIVITATAVPAYRRFQKETDLTNSVEEIMNVLKVAQSKTLASEEDSQWGIYFSTITTPHKYTLFKGTDYASRDVSSDKVYSIPSLVEIYEIDLAGANQEIVFDRLTGMTEQYGQISLKLRENVLETKTIIIENSGQIFHEQAIFDDQNRIKDSRHVHLDYSRSINVFTETLILTFTYNSFSVIENIDISNNMRDNQIDWEGEIEVDGKTQKLKIHTHKLNDAMLGTQFCIHRDRTYNNKILKIKLSADLSGDLIKYDAYGQTTQGTSIYVTEPAWQ